MYDINTVNLAKSLIPFVGWFPDTQINIIPAVMFSMFPAIYSYSRIVPSIFRHDHRGF